MLIDSIDKVYFRWQCEHCGKISKVANKKFDNTRDYKFCYKCSIKHKNCIFCGAEHFRSGKTCSLKCENLVKQQTYLKNYNCKHNFYKDSITRIKQNKNFLEKYGVANPFQLSAVKDKIKKTNLIKFGHEHISQSEEIKKKKLKTREKNFNTEEKKKEIFVRMVAAKVKKGISAPTIDKFQFDLYCAKVQCFTYRSLSQWGNEYFGENWRKIKKTNSLHVDHKFSKLQGFLQKIEPEIIGSIVNLELIPKLENLKKQSNCSISKHQLFNEFNEFEEKIKNENKENN